MLQLFGVSYCLLGITMRDVDSILKQRYWNPMHNAAVLEDPDYMLKDLGIENVVLMVYRRDSAALADAPPELMTRSRFRVVHQEGHPRPELMLLPFDEPFDHLSSASMTSHHALLKQADAEDANRVHLVDIPANPTIRSRVGAARHRPGEDASGRSSGYYHWTLPVRRYTNYLRPYHGGSGRGRAEDGSEVSTAAPSH